jgi:hypothetical protein
MSCPPAYFTGFFRNFPFSTTQVTGRHTDELAKRRLYSLAHLPASPAAGAGIQLFCFASGSIARGTRFIVHHFYVAIHTRNDFIKPYLDPHEQICTGLGAGSPLTPAKEIKDIPEPGEVGVESTASITASTGIRTF